VHSRSYQEQKMLNSGSNQQFAIDRVQSMLFRRTAFALGLFEG